MKGPASWARAAAAGLFVPVAVPIDKGQLFPTRGAVRTAAETELAAAGRAIKNGSSSGRVTFHVVCKTWTSWFVKAQRQGSGDFKVTQVGKDHVNCVGGGQRPSAYVVQPMIDQLVRINPKIGGPAIKQTLKTAGFDISDRTSQRSKRRIATACRAEEADAIARIPSLCEAVERDCPGSVATVEGQGTGPVAPTEEAQGALDASSATQGNSSSSISFRAAGETNTNKVAELPDFKDNNLSGEGSDAYRSGHDNAVALSKEEAEKASREKAVRPRHDKKWSVGADLHLMSIVAKHEVWCVAGGKKILEDEWEAAHGEFQQEPAVRISAAKKRSVMESPFEQLVRKQGARSGSCSDFSSNSDASRAFDCSNTSADDMTEDEARLEKSTMAVVDAKADIKADKTEERLKNADKDILDAVAVGMDSRQYGPGAIAISFGDAHASDERALVGVLRRRNSGAGATASSRMNGNASGRSSPATTGGTPAGVPALGYELRLEIGVLDTNELGKLAGATREELDLFVNTGFLVEQIDRERAVKMIEEVIKSRFKKVWGGKVLLKFVGDESESNISGASDVVGLGALCFSELCVHYGVEDDTFYTIGLKANWFVNGWRANDVPTTDEFDRLTKALVSMLLDGHYSTGLLSNGGGRDSGNGSSSVLGSGNDERAGETDAPSGSGPSRQSKSDGNTKRSDEVNLEGMLEQLTRESKEKAYQGELRADSRETRKKKRKGEEMQEYRKLRKMELDAERELRADERTAAAATEDAIRKEEHIAAAATEDAIRKEERIAADAISREERITADAIRREERIVADAIRRKEHITADAIRREERIAMLQVQSELFKTVSATFDAG